MCYISSHIKPTGKRIIYYGLPKNNYSYYNNGFVSIYIS